MDVFINALRLPPAGTIFCSVEGSKGLLTVVVHRLIVPDSKSSAKTGTVGGGAARIVRTNVAIAAATRSCLHRIWRTSPAKPNHSIIFFIIAFLTGQTTRHPLSA